MCTERRSPRRAQRRQHGLTLIELIVALSLAGVLLGSMWNAWSLMGRGSADPLVARQQLAIAQSLLREMSLQPISGASAVATPGRTGYASITDYNGLAMSGPSGITDVEGAPVSGLSAYGATVSVTPQALAGVPAGSGYWITVSVTGPDARALVLGQWRSKR
jgi:MSHA pilin protein MshD